jgi:uncharacterized membrane protein
MVLRGLEELMDGIGFLVTLAGFVLVLVALKRTSRLQGEIAQLKLLLGQLQNELSGLRQTGVAPVPEAAVDFTPATENLAIEPDVDVAAPEPDTALPEQPVITEAPANANWQPPQGKAAPRGDMEQAIAARWFVWIGGIAIAIGGLLFVKYAYDNGLISPTLQVILGLVAAAVLVGAGEAVRRKATGATEASYVPAALSAAGLATGFASIYAAYALYELVTPLVAFGGLAAIGIGALALSRLQGPLIAALGLIGSYATPALIPSEHPSAWSFFPYLVVILAASFATLRGRNWWWLGYAAIAGSFAWALLWIGGPFAVGDTLPVGLFALVLGGGAMFGLSGRAILGEDSGMLLPRTFLTPPLAIGLCGLLAEATILMGQVQLTHHTDTALVLFFIGMAGFMALGWLKSGVTVLAVLATVLSFLTLMVWDEVAFHTLAMDERGLWSSVLGGDAGRFFNWMLGAGAGLTLAGLAGMKLRPAKSLWSLTAGLAAVLFVTGAWSRIDGLHSDVAWAALAALAALLLLAVAMSHRADPSDTTNHPAGFLAIASAILLVFAIDRLADNVWMTLAVAGLAVFYALGARLLRAWAMGPIASMLGTFATVRLFVSRELRLDQRDLPLGQHWVLYGYGVPAAAFLVASRALKAAGHVRSAIALEGLSLGLVISLISLELRILIGGGLTANEPQLLEMAAHIVTWAGAAYGLMYRQQLYSSLVSLWGSRLLFAASVAGMMGLSLTTLNPVVTGDPVSGNVIFNALLLAYLAPVPLLGLIARRLAALRWEMLRPAVGLLALILIFAYVTLETKRVFQGPMLVPWSQTIAESYAYSAVWLGLAVALFAAGLRLGQQYVRYAGLGVMVLVVLKVFLWDMSSLEGLYRIASFVGLGLCLVGIGWLYQRFVQQPKPA